MNNKYLHAVVGIQSLLLIFHALQDTELPSSREPLRVSKILLTNKADEVVGVLDGETPGGPQLRLGQISAHGKTYWSAVVSGSSFMGPAIHIRNPHKPHAGSYISLGLENDPAFPYLRMYDATSERHFNVDVDVAKEGLVMAKKNNAGETVWFNNLSEK